MCDRHGPARLKPGSVIVGRPQTAAAREQDGERIGPARCRRVLPRIPPCVLHPRKSPHSPPRPPRRESIKQHTPIGQLQARGIPGRDRKCLGTRERGEGRGQASQSSVPESSLAHNQVARTRVPAPHQHRFSTCTCLPNGKYDPGRLLFGVSNQIRQDSKLGEPCLHHPLRTRRPGCWVHGCPSPTAPVHPCLLPPLKRRISG